MSNIRWGVFAAVCAIFISVTLGVFSGVAFIHIFIRALIFGAVFFGLGFGLRFVMNNFFPELLMSSEETAKQEEQIGSRINITLDSTGEFAVPELYKAADGSDELGNIEDLISGNFRSRRRDPDDESELEDEKPISNQWFESPLTEEGIDRKKEEGYNDMGFIQDITFDDLPGIEKSASTVEKPAAGKPEVFQPQFTPSFGDDSGLGGLPDLDMMARAFSTAYSGPSAPVQAASTVLPPEPSESMGFTATSPVSSTSSFYMTAEPEPDRSNYMGNKPQQLEGDFNPKDLAKGISTILSKD
ncbi:MAG: hypothetical protein FWD24_05895 [Treponema sp.]|nr:hypothetical protein [Treponema sp.]